MIYSLEILISNQLQKIEFDDEKKTFSHVNLGNPTIELTDDSDGSKMVVDKQALSEGKLKRIV